MAVSGFVAVCKERKTTQRQGLAYYSIVKAELTETNLDTENSRNVTCGRARLSPSKARVKPAIKDSLALLKDLEEYGDNHQHHTDFFKYGNQRNGILKTSK